MNEPNQAKRDIRGFERFIAEGGTGWPQSLRDRGHRARLALRTLDAPHPAEPMVREAAKDMADFLAALAEWSAGK